jgi:hypothetical protein
MAEDNVTEATLEIVQHIARCLQLPSDFAVLNEAEQLLLQLYIGNIIRLPFKEPGQYFQSRKGRIHFRGLTMLFCI